MVRKYTPRNFYPSPIVQVARGRFKEEEWLPRDGVLQLLHMFGIIATNGNDLNSWINKIHQKAGAFKVPSCLW